MIRNPFEFKYSCSASFSWRQINLFIRCPTLNPFFSFENKNKNRLSTSFVFSIGWKNLFFCLTKYISFLLNAAIELHRKRKKIQEKSKSKFSKYKFASHLANARKNIVIKPLNCQYCDMSSYTNSMCFFVVLFAISFENRCGSKIYYIDTCDRGMQSIPLQHSANKWK